MEGFGQKQSSQSVSKSKSSNSNTKSKVNSCVFDSESILNSWLLKESLAWLNTRCKEGLTESKVEAHFLQKHGGGTSQAVCAQSKAARKINEESWKMYRRLVSQRGGQHRWFGTCWVFERSVIQSGFFCSQM